MIEGIARNLCKANARLGLFTPAIKDFAFIIGAMKSGTTTLYEYLIQHPQVARNWIQKEPEFFSRQSAPDDLSPYRRQFFPMPSGRSIALEASTGYTKTPFFPNVAKRLRLLEGRKHFIYILRDPIDRIESHIAHNLASQHLTLNPGERPNFEHFQSVSKYASQLEAYKSEFPDIRVKIVMFEDLRKNAICTVEDVAEHLSLERGFQWRLLPPQNTRRSRFGADKFRLLDQERAVLRRILADDMTQLEAEYGVNVARWGFH